MPLRLAILLAALLAPAAASAASPTVPQRNAPVEAAFRQQELNATALRGSRSVRSVLRIRLPGRFVALQPYEIANSCLRHGLVVRVAGGYPPLASLTVGGTPASGGRIGGRTVSWTWRAASRHRALLTIVNESPRARSYTVDYVGCLGA